MIRRVMEWLFGPALDDDDNLSPADAEVSRMVALTDRLAQSEAARFALVEQLAEACKERDRAERSLNNESHASIGLMDALTAIAAQETPGANATVKRMARIAREALE